jgi:hypothetical protein
MTAAHDKVALAHDWPMIRNAKIPRVDAMMTGRYILVVLIRIAGELTQTEWLRIAE